MNFDTRIAPLNRRIYMNAELIGFVISLVIIAFVSLVVAGDVGGGRPR